MGTVESAKVSIGILPVSLTNPLVGSVMFRTRTIVTVSPLRRPKPSTTRTWLANSAAATAA